MSDFNPESEREALTEALSGTTAAKKAGGTGRLVERIIKEGSGQPKQSLPEQPPQTGEHPKVSSESEQAPTGPPGVLGRLDSD
jgi:hypothetical protein